MILLDALDLIKPEIGLFFWTVFIFVLLWLILGRFAFKPIGEALRKRENSIEEALKMAEKARMEMASMKAENEKLIQEAREERGRMLKEARQTAEDIINDAKDKSRAEADKILADSKREIENQKQAALTEVKNEVGVIALDIAEKVLRRELADKKDQESYIEELIKKVEMN